MTDFMSLIYISTLLQTSLHMLLELADSAILPYNIERFPKTMFEALETLEKSTVPQQLENFNSTLKFIKEAVIEFEKAAKNFMKHVHSFHDNDHNPVDLRMLNDQMMQLERVFNMPQGM